MTTATTATQNTSGADVERTTSGVLKFQGEGHFRQRVVCATLTGTKIVIDNIRMDDERPGIRDFEANFLRLIEKLTNGCEFIINETGTRVHYRPGFIVGGKFEHDCGTGRGLGYFIEPLLCLAPFGKKELQAKLMGITNDDQDVNVDVLRTVMLPTLKYFGVTEGLSLKIKKRGAPPEGGGMVELCCPVVRELTPVQLLDEGLVRRIRGIAYSTRVSPQTANRMVDSARGILNQYQQDVFIYTDHYKGSESGLSPGFALSLVAETTTGFGLSAQATAEPGETPEQVGQKAAIYLLQEVANRGCVDSAHQSFVLLLMVLCPDSISKVRLGKLTPYTVQYLRHLYDFFGIKFKLEGEQETKTTLCTCRGSGFKNLSKRVY